MSGASLMLNALGGASGGGGGGGGFGNHPNALAWSNVFGATSASTQVLTIVGVGGGTAPITVTNSGSATLFYTQNGVSMAYTGSFNVSDADTLGWWLLNLTIGTKSGTITVSSGAFIVGTYNYVITGNNNF